MEKTYKVSNKELYKWTRILGARKMIDLYVDGKIYLSSEQLDMVINIKNNPCKDESERS